MAILGFIGIFALLIFSIFLFNCLLTPHEPWIPPSREDEIEWLIKDCGMSIEEAEEIADLSWPK